jgi:SAM-dependent methyltransferase
MCSTTSPSLPPVSRKLNWVSSVDPANSLQIEALQKRMVEFYATSASYYGDIDFTAGAWKTDPVYRDISARLEESGGDVLEVGCGASNILLARPGLQRRYTGCDFSASLLEKNRARFAGAQFQALGSPAELPFAEGMFGAVFSVYVLEHTLRPAVFLDECVRVLRPGGIFILRCPHYLAQGKMPSQRAGLGYGTGRQKLAHGRLWDALSTAYDRKVAIPSRCAQLRRQIADRRSLGFWINLAPVCFADAFEPDHDAVYLTYEAEIQRYLEGRISFDSGAARFADPDSIYLVGTKAAVIPNDPTGSKGSTGAHSLQTQ